MTLLRHEKIIASLGTLEDQNKPVLWEGRLGIWCQSDCVHIPIEEPVYAVNKFRFELSRAGIAISHNHFCGSIMREKERIRADAYKEILETILKNPKVSQEDAIRRVLAKWK